MRHFGPCLIAIILAGGTVYGQAPAQHQALVQADEMFIPGPPHNSVSEWNGSMLVGCDQCQSSGPIVFTVDRQGPRDELVFELPGSGYISVNGISAGPDGALALVGYGLSNDSKIASFIAWIAPDRKRQIVTRVWPYRPYRVTVAPDGTIWTVGPVKKGDTREDLIPNVLRHYEASGHMLATADVKARPVYGSAEVSAASMLMASNDRIGWQTWACEYVEFSFKAEELGRYDCPLAPVDSHDLDGMALSADNHVLVGAKRNTPFAPLELNRATRTWDPVSVPAEVARDWHQIIGFDGVTLVTTLGGGKLRRFNWGASGVPAAGGH